MFEAQFWKLLRNFEAQPKFTLSYKKSFKREVPVGVFRVITCFRVVSQWKAVQCQNSRKG